MKVSDIVRHELIGLPCMVVDAKNKSQIGLEGVVADETLKTIVVGNKRIPKKGSVFRIKKNNHVVDLEGDHLLSRPEDRIKKKFKKW